MLDCRVVQQGAWDMPLESMPLAAGYLKATIDADTELSAEVQVRIQNFRGGVPLPEMAGQIFRDGLPDVIAFSVLGWNYRNFGFLADTYKQLHPTGLVVFGGNHVANQGQRTFRDFPSVDIVVNGEGEFTLRDILLANLDGHDLHEIAGITVQTPDGQHFDTPERTRIDQLDVVPSPFLTGSIPMLDGAGHFRYDVSLMETNRGCPYKCAFCYWGGAVGQRVRSFSRERLAAELDYFGFHQAPTIVLCDANFGMLEADEEFVEDLIKTKERHGYPRALETSWAKNKSARFHRIVRDLKKHDMKSSFTLALQTLSDDALTDMNRRNMKVNQWQDLATWLTEEGLDCYAELIWGAPGETPGTFLEGYDELAERVPRIAIYPLLLLPNTDYTENKKLHGLVTLRGEQDDFEYVLASRSAGLTEHLEMQRFMFWARILSENQYFRFLWSPLRLLAGLRHSQVIHSIMSWFDGSDDPAAERFLELVPTLAESPAVARGVRALYESTDLADVIRRWWAVEMVPQFAAEWQDFATELLRYEECGRPVYVRPASTPPDGWRDDPADSQRYRSRPVSFRYDMRQVLTELNQHADMPAPAPRRPRDVVFRALRGFYEHCDNHETAVHYSAEPYDPNTPTHACHEPRKANR